MRFWFRFVFPYQEDLKTGLAAGVLYRQEIEPQLADHVSPTFEALCREWVLRSGRATRVGAWWGNALNEHRRNKTRTTEEVDVVGLTRSFVTVVGESKWTRQQMPLAVLEELREYKVPAMREAKIRFANNGPQIVLFSRGGFSARLEQAAEQRSDVTLISVEQLVIDLLAVGD
jgi:hypothetical protein